MTQPVRGNAASRTPSDLRPHDTAALIAAVRRDFAEGIRITAGWDRRRLLDVALTLAAGAAQANVVATTHGKPPRPATGPAHDEWDAQELLDAHAAHARGDRGRWAVEGERTYQRLRKRNNGVAS